MKPARLLIAAYIVLVAVAASYAGVRHINADDGLASRQIYALEEDSDGYIWVYTNAGLDRYDGHGVKHYSLDTDNQANDHVLSTMSMRRSPDGTLWVALKSGEIYHYDRSADTFAKAFDLSSNAEGLYSFVFTPDTSLIVGTNNGVYLCHTGREPQRVALEGRLVRSLTADDHGGVYAGTDSGVWRIDPAKRFHALPVKGTDNIYVRSLAVSGGKLFVGSFSSGMHTIDIATGRVGRLPFSIPHIPVNALRPYGSDSLLIGVDGAGVYLIQSSDGSLIRHYHDENTDGADTSLSGNTVTDVLVDGNMGIWVATSHKGLNYVAPYSHTVSTVRRKGDSNNSLVSDYINVIFEDPDGDIWYGTDKGVSRFNPRTGQWQAYLHSDNFHTSVVLALGCDSLGRIWAGSYGDGVSIIDKHTGRVERMPARTASDTTGLATDYVFATRRDKDGNMWIGGINGEITRYDTRTGRYSYYDEDCIATIVPHTGSSILFGGNKGVGTWNRNTDRFDWTTRFDTVGIAYPVRCLISDTTAANIWIGTTGDGLIRYNTRSHTARRFTTADGLSTNAIYSIVRDHAGRIWVCTETDLYRIEPGSDKLSRLTYFLGSTREAFCAGAALVDANGNIMLGTADGCVVFNPDWDFGQPGDGGILFTDFKLHGRTVAPGGEGSPLRRNINLTDHLRLSSTQNSIEIDFGVINHADPQRVGFSYMLEGFDRAFSEPGTSRSARYAELPPGSYTFRLSAVDLYTGRIIGERSLAVTVDRPLWQSWWAILAYAIIFASLLTLAIGYIRRRNSERRIEGQIQAFATMAHDIRTPMSLIKAPLLNIELEKDLSDKARSNLEQARRSVDRTMEMLAEMLELRRDTRRPRRLTVAPCDISDFLHEKAEEYTILARFKGLEIKCDIEPGMPVVMIDTDSLGHIIDNLMSNAIKYTDHGSISLGAKRIGRKRWQLSVADTGMGISHADARRLFHCRHRAPGAVEADSAGMGMGLLITRRLVKFHKGRIFFRSTPGEGSVFTIELPLSFPARNMARTVQALPAADTRPDDSDSAAASTDTDTRSRIFIVEDDPAMLAYMKQTLGTDYDVTCSSDPLQMLEAIRRDNPDLVITDIMMPKLRGDELCRMVKTDIATSHIPVILLSGLACREDIVAGLEAHADDYVVKPFDIVVLKARIRNIIKSRRRLNSRVIDGGCEAAEEDFTNELDRNFMAKVMETVNAHLADSEFSVSDLCTDLGMSRTSVYNKIKALTGQSLNEFIRIVRLNRSKELLATRRYNISEVAYMVGFSDPKYFSTCFKKQFGISPSKM